MSLDVNKITDRQKLIIKKGLLDYKFIMDNWQKDVNDADFQDVYYEFYMTARWSVYKKNDNAKAYFTIFGEKESAAQEDLESVLNTLRKRLHKESYEFSLASKLLHTINPNLPIYDSKVREYLLSEQVSLYWNVPNRISGADRGMKDLDKILHDWKGLCDWYNRFLKGDGKEWGEWFDKNFPDSSGISDVKKIDFIIFATN